MPVFIDSPKNFCCGKVKKSFPEVRIGRRFTAQKNGFLDAFDQDIVALDDKGIG